MKVKVKTAESDCEYTDSIVCPFCGYVVEESWEYEEGESQGVCPECDRTFELEIMVQTHYTTRPNTYAFETDMFWEEGHVFEDGLTKEEEARAQDASVSLEVVE